MTWVWNYSCQIKNDEMSSSSIFSSQLKIDYFFSREVYTLSFCIDPINNYMNVVVLLVRNPNSHCYYIHIRHAVYMDGKVQTPCENTFSPKYNSRLNTCSWVRSKKITLVSSAALLQSLKYPIVWWLFKTTLTSVVKKSKSPHYTTLKSTLKWQFAPNALIFREMQ